MAQQFIRISQAAKLLGKTPRQLRRMEENGDLIPAKHQGGQRFYDQAEIEELARIDRDMRQVAESPPWPWPRPLPKGPASTAQGRRSGRCWRRSRPHRLTTPP